MTCIQCWFLSGGLSWCLGPLEQLVSQRILSVEELGNDIVPAAQS